MPQPHSNHLDAFCKDERHKSRLTLRACLHHFPRIQDRDQICIHDRLQAMRHHQHGDALELAMQGVLQVKGKLRTVCGNTQLKRNPTSSKTKWKSEKAKQVALCFPFYFEIWFSLARTPRSLMATIPLALSKCTHISRQVWGGTTCVLARVLGQLQHSSRLPTVLTAHAKISSEKHLD